MGKKFTAFLLALLLFVSMAQSSFAQNTDIYNLPISPIPCNKVDPSLSCPVNFLPQGDNIYGQLKPPERCASSYTDFLSDPIGSHYWVEDPAITNQGKSDERARQFLYWVLNTNAVDESPVLRTIWNFSSVIALVGVVLVATIFGLGYIISRRGGNVYNGIGNFFAGGSGGIAIGPTVIKIGTMLLYVAFSSAIVFILVQFSEILMRFFYENLGGKDLFSIYFVNPGDSTLGATEQSYKGFVGCRDLNIRVQEGVHTEMFLLKMTNVSYYVMGVMLLLRKILLWFMLFVAPFLALLMPFVFIRNTGWIWIGVFFQWLFYGPLVALFLGAVSKIWKEGIPFSFDFSRAGDIAGYVYPTGMNIVYGGPAQRIAGAVSRPIGALNNGNYIDTFAEYILTLIMLWAVTFFPWWLLRIFRDYCCEGIYAMKNILLAMYDNMRGGPSKGPSPSHPPSLPSLKIDTQTPIDRDIKINVGTLNQIKHSLTKDLTRTLNLQATRITDVARVETNKQMRQTVNQNLAYISNPVQAKVPAQRQQFMNLRSELFNRAIKNDAVARTILASTSTTVSEKSKIRETLMQSMPQTISVSQVVAKDMHIPQEAFSKITTSYTTQISNNIQAVQKLAQSAGTNTQTVHNVLNTYNKYTSQPVNTVISTIARETNTSEKIVKHVLHDAGLMSAQSRFVQNIATTQKLTKEQVSKVLQSIKSTVLRETTIADRVSSETHTSAENVRSLISETFTNAASNTTLTTTIAEKSATTPQNVQSIMQAYATSVESSTKDVVQNISKTTNIDQSTVSNVLQEASTQIQNHSTLQQTAQKIGIEVEQAKSVVRLAVDATVEAAVSSKPIITVINDSNAPSQQVSTASIQNIFKTISQDNNTTTTIAQTTQTTQQQVQNVLESYAQHINERSSAAVTSIASETSMSVSQIKDIMNTTSTTVQNSPQVKEKIVKESKLDHQTTEKIIQSIPKSLQIVAKEQSIINSIHSSNTTLQNITNSEAQSVVSSLAQNSEVINNVATQTNVSQENVAKTLNTFASNIANTSSETIQTIAQQTQLSHEQVHNILQSASSFVTNNPQVTTQIAESTKVEQSVVRATISSLPQTVTKERSKESIIQQIQSSAQKTQAISQESTTNIVNSITNNTDVIKHVSQDTMIEENIVQQSLATFASNLTQNSSQLISTIAKTSNISQDQAQSIVQSAATYATANTEIQNQTAQTNNSTSTDVKNIVENVHKAVASHTVLSQIQNSSSNLQSVTKENITSVFSEIANNDQFVESIAQKETITNDTVKNIINSYANSIDQTSSQTVQNIASSTNSSAQTVQNVMGSVAQYSNKYQQSVQSIAQTTNLEETTIQELLKTTSDVMVKTAESKNPVIQELAPQKSTLTSENITTVIQSLATPSVVTQVAQDTNISSEKINTVIHELSQNLNQSSESLMQSIANTTQLSDENIIQVIQSVTTQAISNKQVVNSISGQTSLPAPQITSIIETTAAVVSSKTPEPTQTIKEQITEQMVTTKGSQFTQETVTNIFQEITQVQSIVSSVAEKTQTTDKQVQQVFQEFNTHISESSSQLPQSIADNAHISVEQVQAIMTTTSQIIDQSPEVRSLIATKTNTSASTVQQIVTAVPQAMTVAPTNTTSIIKEVAQSSQTNEATSQQIIQSLMNTAVENNSFVENLAEEHHLKFQQIKNILTTYSHNVSQPSETLIQTINQSSGVPKDQVRSIILSLTSSILSSHEIIGQVAQAEGMNEKDVSNVMQQQLELASEPEKHIEKTISIPKTISLEDYEEVKEMWTKHFEEGEVPVSETIKTRKDWIDQEVVYITNTLNKILSSDEKLQQEGLDELGYLLPIFLINNLKGDELIVYLKAKLEAAKLVMKILEHEEKAKNEIKEDEEEEVFVDVAQEDSAEEPKHMALDEEEEEAPRSIEERVKAVQEKLKGAESSDNPETTNLSINDIKTRLNDASVSDKSGKI
ncbi:MAG: hypothetical protein Q8P72_05200 [Candidatus Roizmanbacteria bacterium]|nr:hypothetical protein [Candidatus Roizmanbacteria bacterium]